MGKLFEQYPKAEVPPLSWFKKVIPKSDPYGITYDALVRLEEYTSTYSPDEPQDVWDTAPLRVLIRWYLQAGCEVYKASDEHRETCFCLDCDACEREDVLISDSMTCWRLIEWIALNEEELEDIPKGGGPITCIPPQVLEEFKERLEA